MAVEVVGHHEGAYKQKPCMNCGSMLRYLLMDVQKRQHTDYSGTTETYHFIICPKCQGIVEVKGY